MNVTEQITVYVKWRENRLQRRDGQTCLCSQGVHFPHGLRREGEQSSRSWYGYIYINWKVKLCIRSKCLRSEAYKLFRIPFMIKKKKAKL